ncbi:hypothetical protein QA646_27185 (plasmid) [Rhizobium sp. CB3090]|uniref:hypothetical protein n=1 Tax=Rhizobium sp. CB3090 TaxID=3039156 RepID=UPI0024B132AF|nr:hypothetical protein [Rhizobium sp. CB3090]WFU13043.1 hypothetical protein QA646_27185 [Rhizobium sp. CB3090]
MGEAMPEKMKELFGNFPDVWMHRRQPFTGHLSYYWRQLLSKPVGVDIAGSGSVVSLRNSTFSACCCSIEYARKMFIDLPKPATRFRAFVPRLLFLRFWQSQTADGLVSSERTLCRLAAIIVTRQEREARNPGTDATIKVAAGENRFRQETGENLARIYSISSDSLQYSQKLWVRYVSLGS